MKNTANRRGWFAGAEVAAAGDFTVRQVSIFFTIYVFFQVWNQINCRSLTPETSGFHRILGNPTFLAIAAIVAIGQVLIVTFGGTVFKVEPLSVVDLARYHRVHVHGADLRGDQPPHPFVEFTPPYEGGAGGVTRA